MCMHSANKLIVIEGIDGVGKSTLCESLCKKLKTEGINARNYESIEDPNSIFNNSKKRVKEETVINAQLYFYIASAIQKSAVIDEMLENSWIICDRYIYSTYAYHTAMGVNLKNIPPLDLLPIRKPDFSFLLTVKESIRLQRIINRSNNDDDDYIIKSPKSHLDIFEKVLMGFNLQEINTNMPRDMLVEYVYSIIVANNLYK